MAGTRPSVALDWAENNVVDPTSGQNNKVEPPTAWKNNGWGYQEKPPRNYDNYHKWNAGQWVKYLDESCARPATYIVAASNATAESKAHADAKCDGTNDEVELQAAIDAVETAGGGLVLLTEGTFTILDGIDLKSEVHIIGCGLDATIIKVAATASTDFSILSAVSRTEFSVGRLTIDGSAASIGQNHIGVEIDGCSMGVLRDMEVGQIDRDSSGGIGVSVDGSTDILIDNVRIVSCVWYGLSITDSENVTYVNSVVKLNGAANITTDANATRLAFINVESTSSVANGADISAPYSRVVGCSFNGNGIHGLKLGSYVIVQGSEFTENGQHGIRLVSGDYNVITGNLIRGNSQTTDNTYDGISIDASSDSNMISGNLVHQGAAANKHRYGIDCASSTNYVVGNYLLGSGQTGNLNGTVKLSWTAGLVGAPQIYDAGAAGHVNITGQLTNVTA